MDIINNIKEELFNNKDEKYKDFNASLIPTINKDCIIGVRIPIIRKMAKKYFKDQNINLFLNDLPHKYHDENLLHAFIIEQIKDYDLLIKRLDQFLPYINNWATCDSLRPKIFKKNLNRLEKDIIRWIKSDLTYTIRFSILVLMNYYLDDEFDLRFLKMVINIKSEEYYVNMMISWYLATALAKKWDVVIPYINKNYLNEWVLNKTIQKAKESYRITLDQKKLLEDIKKSNLQK